MGGMGGGDSGNKGNQAPAPSGAAGSPTAGISTEYEANKPQVMPVYNSPGQIESARRKRQEIMARSGRQSTNLRGNPGTQSYQGSFLGNVA